MDEAQVILGMIFKASQNAAVVVQPRKQTLDLPAAPIAAQGPAILRRWALTIPLVRRNQFKAAQGQAVIQRVAVIGPVANQALGPDGEKTPEKSRVDQGDFMRCSRRRVDGERKTRAVCHRHELRTFAPFGCSHVPSFFSPQ